MDGYLRWQDPLTGRTVAEADSLQCRHCRRHVVVRAHRAGVQDVGWCGRCGAPVCARCAADGRCTPFEARLQVARNR